MSRLICRLLVLTVLITSIVRPAFAQNLSLISDAETERMIREFAAPVFAAAGLTTDSVSVHIVNDRALNAFVAGGQRIFLFTGLLVEADHPGQIIGVLAHETGHISGSHLARTQDALRGANAIAVVAAVLGVAAAVAGGGGAAGAAVVGGGTQVAGQSILQYSRVQESAADQAAVRFFEDTGQSSRGLIEVLQKLGDQEALLRRNQTSYGRTHPLSRDRILALERLTNSSPSRDAEPTPEQIAAFDRVRAKVMAFLNPKRAMKEYGETDTSVPARYARAAANHQLTNPDRAIAEIDSLIADFPDDPFFHELKGQIIFENGGRGERSHPFNKPSAWHRTNLSSGSLWVRPCRHERSGVDERGDRPPGGSCSDRSDIDRRLGSIGHRLWTRQTTWHVEPGQRRASHWVGARRRCPRPRDTRGATSAGRISRSFACSRYLERSQAATLISLAS